LTLLSDMTNFVIMRGIDGLRRFMNKLSTHKSCEYSQSVHEDEGIITHNMCGL